jgi:hypothetical protein
MDPLYPTCVALGGWSATDGSAMVKIGSSYSGRIKLVRSAIGSAPPAGFQLVGSSNGYYWNFEAEPPIPPGTPIQLCLKYADTWVSGLEGNLSIEHGTATGWTTLTGPVPDVTANEICKNTPSLSPFILVEPLPDQLPVVTVPADMTVGATSTGGAVVPFAASAVDPQDGPVAVTCAPASGNQFPVGTSTVTCTAVDGQQIKGQASFSILVRYDAPSDGTFFAQPINPDNSSIFKAGSTISVKFKLTGASAGITNLVAHISLARVSSGVTGTYVETTSNAAPDGGNTFRYDPSSSQYVYNLSTKGMATGTWSVRVDLGDGVSHTVNVSLK